MSAEPHTITSSGWVEFTLVSKKYSGDIDAIWGFNRTESKPSRPQLWANYTHTLWRWVEVDYGNYTRQEKEYYNSTFYDWKDVKLDFSVKNITAKGMDTWYLLRQVSVVAGKEYKLRCWVEIPFAGKEVVSGKYAWGVKLSSDTIQEAIDNDRFYFMDPWFHTIWLNRKKISVDSDKINEVLNNFTVLVYLNSSRIKWANVQDDLDDLRFTSDDGLTLLDYEIESYTANDEAWLWVRLPTVSNITDTDFYMYYSNAGASSGEDKTGAWDNNYVMVQHMVDDPDNANIRDSTDNDNDGAKKGANEPIETVDGKIDSAQHFDGVDDYVTIADVPELDSLAITVEAWIKRNSSDPNQFIVTRGRFGVPDPWIIGVAAGGQLYSNIKCTGTNANRYWGFTPLVGTWYHVVLVYSDSLGLLTYVDNLPKNTKAADGTIDDGSANCRIGLSDHGFNLWNGTTDELRISNITRSVAWIKASYNSDNDDLLKFRGVEYSYGAFNVDHIVDIVLHTEDANIAIGEDLRFTQLNIESQRVFVNNTYWGIYPLTGTVDLTLNQFNSTDRNINFTSDGTETIYNFTWATPCVRELSGNLTSVIIDEYVTNKVNFTVTGTGTTSVKVNCSPLGEPTRVLINDTITVFTYNSTTSMLNFTVPQSKKDVRILWGVVPGPSLLEYYKETNYDSDGVLDGNHPSGDGDESAFGQAFTSTETGKLTRVEFYLKKVLAPTGDATAQLFACTGTPGSAAKPTGVVLATSDVFDVSTLTTSYQVITFNFTGVSRYELQNGTNYCIVYVNPAAGVDNANYVMIGQDNSGPTHAGNSFYYDNGAWTGYTTDILFYLGINGDTAPENIALGSDATFNRNLGSWVNATVQEYPITGLSYVDIRVNTSENQEYFILRWNQSSGVFSEVSDDDDICTLDDTNSTRVNLDYITDQICFRFKITGGTDGNADVILTTTDDQLAQDTDTYSNEFLFVFYGWSGVGDLLNSAFDYFYGAVFNFMSMAQTYLIGLMTYFATSMTNMLALVVQMFRVINGVFTFCLDWLTRMVTLLIDVFTIVVSILDGTGDVTTGLGDIWELFSVDDLVDFMPVVLLVYWMISLDERAPTHGFIASAYGDVNMVLNLISFFVQWFSMVIDTVINLVMMLIDTIPGL